MQTDQSLRGRIALVTGASRGIGQAIAVRLAEAGSHVVAVARTLSGLEAINDILRRGSGQVTLAQVDLTDHHAIEALSQNLLDRFGKLDILVGNAGVSAPLLPIRSVAANVWDEALAVNLTSNWHLIRCLEPLLLNSDAGRAVFISSGLSWRALPLWAPYAASKAALNALVQTWAAECAYTNLRVNLFSPGPVRTKLREDVLPNEDQGALELPENVAAKLIDLCVPAFTSTGRLYDYRKGRLLTFPEPF